MVLQRVITFTKNLEDPKNPVLGPTLKGLYFFGLWQTGSKFHTTSFKIFHFSTLLFIISQFIGLYVIRNDLTKVLDNISLIGLNLVCVAKCYGYVLLQSLWKQLAQEISEEELTQMRNQDKVISKLMDKYTKYTRIVTYLFWVMVLVSYLLLILSLFFRYLTSKSYFDDKENNIEPLPLVAYSWFPFDSSQMPGYLGAVLIQIVMVTQAAGLIAVYDTNAVAIMSYLKGQMVILKKKCKTLFHKANTRDVIKYRIKECHRHHNTLVKHHKMFNELLSPTMFIYVLICAITICCSVFQLSSVSGLQQTLALKIGVFIAFWRTDMLLFGPESDTEVTNVRSSMEAIATTRDFDIAILRIVITETRSNINTVAKSLIVYVKNIKEVTSSQKMIWAVPYTMDLVVQLFLYSWHSNEVIIESGDVDQGVYASDWWKADVSIRREILLLAGKLSKPLKLEAGPYTTLSVPTFIHIMKGTYSFYTLISQMQDK